MIKKLDIKNFTPNPNHTIWDVRDAKSYKEGHILHAVNHPIDTLSKELLDATAGDIYVLCGGGAKAERACILLDEYDNSRNIIHLVGGTRGAKSLGMEIVTKD